MKDKIKYIFIPFLYTLVGLNLVYSFLHWLLLIKFHLFEFHSIYVNVAGPAVLAGLAAFFYLRPPLKALKLGTKKGGTWKDFYSILTLLFLGAPLVVAQFYLDTATGKLITLNSIKEINQHELSKYYSLKHFYIDKYDIGVHPDFEVSGKHNESFNMHIYIALPIFEQESDTSAHQDPLAWLGLVYKKTVSNRLEPNEKEEAYQAFAKETQKEFDETSVSDFVYLDRINMSDDKEGFITAIKENTKYKPNQTVMVAVHEPFEARNGSMPQLLVIFTLAGSVLFLLMTLIPPVNEEHMQRIKENKPDVEAQQATKEFLEFLKPREGYFVTPILIYANVGVYLLMVFSGLGIMSFDSQDLLHWGANYKPLTLQGEEWRLLTSTFLHGGLIHLAANMYGLLFVGIFLEPLLGKTKYLLAYLVTGILASCASIWWYDATVSVGASGAIFGLYGMFLAFLVTKTFAPEFAKSFLLSTLVFVGINLLMGLTGGIDNAAHIGGLVSGFIIGLLFRLTLKETENYTGEE